MRPYCVFMKQGEKAISGSGRQGLKEGKLYFYRSQRSVACTYAAWNWGIIHYLFNILLSTYSRYEVNTIHHLESKINSDGVQHLFHFHFVNSAELYSCFQAVAWRVLKMEPLQLYFMLRPYFGPGYCLFISPSLDCGLSTDCVTAHPAS